MPDEVRDELAARAARSGRSLQEYLLAELTAAAGRPDKTEVLARARQRVALTGSVLGSATILAHRDADRR